MKLSVITPCLNAGETIRSCIESVQSQADVNVEHIVMDGGSTDNTLAILEEMNVTYFSSSDAGLYDAINKGILKCTGDVIHILNADDYYINDSVVKFALRNIEEGNLDILHGKVNQVDIDNNVIWSIGEDVKYSDLLRKMKVAHPSVFVRSNVYAKYGGFSIGFKIAADYEFLLRVWNKVSTGYVDTVFVNMRLGGISNTQISNSYIEALSASVMHGRNPFVALVSCYYEIIKHKYIITTVRALGFRN